MLFIHLKAILSNIHIHLYNSSFILVCRMEKKTSEKHKSIMIKYQISFLLLFLFHFLTLIDKRDMFEAMFRTSLRTIHSNSLYIHGIHTFQNERTSLIENDTWLIFFFVFLSITLLSSFVKYLDTYCILYKQMFS